MALSPGMKLGPYEILAPIGAGGMGEVFRARDSRLGRDVAVKVLPDHLAGDAKALHRFETEAKAVAALSHPNVLALHDVGESNGIHYAVTELLEGEPLRALVVRGPVPLKRALEIAHEIAEGLAAAHGKGIVHRDVKPENVFLTKDGHAKLLDFGLVHHETALLDAADTHTPTVSAHTEAGAVMGTLAYMSPEQARGLPVDHRTDQFSLGIVLYEMLAGARPFRGSSSAETLAAIIRDEPESLAAKAPGVPVPVRLIVERCLSKEPRERYDSTRDLARELEAWRLHGSEPGHQVSHSEASPGRRRLVTIALVAVALVVIAVGVSLALRLRKSPPASPGFPSVLALPCKVFGAPEVAFLTDAVPQTISTLLAQVEGLDTKVPPTSLEVDKVKEDLTTLAELYQVSSFIVTSLTTSPGKFALNVQLVDAATRKVRWGRQFEGPREAYNDLARQAAEGIRQAVTPEASPVLPATVPSGAELAFREGSYFSNRYNNLHDPPDFDAALAAFQRALALDPRLAEAAGEIAMLYVYRFESGTMPARDTIPAVESWARRALAISPCSVRGLSALTAVELQRPSQSTRKMVEYGLKAASCGPSDGRAQFFLGYGADPAGLTSVAIAAYLESYRLDPLYVFAPYNAAFWLRALGRPGEALRILDNALKTEPGNPVLVLERVLNLVDLGRLAEAERDLTPLEARAGEDPLLGMLTPMVRAALALAQGNRRAADPAVSQVLSLVRSEKGTGGVMALATAYVVPPLARNGRIAEAVDILQRGADVGAAAPYEFLVRNRDLVSVRSDPRFAGILVRSKKQFDEARQLLEESQRRGELPRYLDGPLAGLRKLLEAETANR